jgi:hypothetical protein
MLSRTVPLVLLSGIAAVLSSCGDSTGPEGGLEVRISATVIETSVDPSRQRGMPELGCAVQLVAEATGNQGARGVWRDGILLYYAGPDRTQPIDSLELSLSDVRNSWHATSIGVGDRQEAHWSFRASLPFRVAGRFRYRVNPGEIKSADFEFSCGPDVPPGGGEAPSITNLTVSPQSGEFEPGDTLTIDYSAASPLGLWSTMAIVSGAFDDTLYYPEEFPTVTSRTVQVVVPPGSSLGQQAEVRIVAMDIVAQVGVSAPSYSAPLVDNTPPIADVWISCPTEGCQYAVTDSFPIGVSARDNHLLGWLIYEVGNPVIARDSVPLLKHTTNSGCSIAVPPEAIGTPTITAYVRDVAGNMAEGSWSFSVGIYPVVDLPTHVVEVDSGYVDVHIDPKRQVLYIARLNLPEIGVLSLPTLAWAPPIELPAEPSGFDLSLSGDSLIVVLPEAEAVAVVDLNQPGAPPSLVPLTAVLFDEGFWPISLRVTANGKWFLVANTHILQKGQLVEIDPAAGVQETRLGPELASSFTFEPLYRSGDRSRMLIIPGCARVYDAATDVIGPCKTFYDNPQWISGVDWAGTLWTNWAHIFDGAFDIVRRVDRPRDTGTTAPSPDGQYIYTSTLGGFDVVRLADWYVERRIAAPPLSNGLILFPEDGSFLVGYADLPGVNLPTHTRIVVVELE